MENWLERLPEGAGVVAIRLRSLGDCVLATPALHLLKNHRPDLRLGVVVEDAFRPVFTGNPDVEILSPSVAAVAGYRAELCLNLHGGTTSLKLTAASRARLRAGFAHFRWQSAYNIRIPSAQKILGVSRVVHTAEHVAAAMFYLGVPPTEIPPARLFPIAPRERAADRPYAVIHPKASAPDKIWPAERFCALAGHVERNLGMEVIFIAGPGETLDEFSGYSCRRGAPLEEIKTLFAGAALFVGNDSGPAHMAAAFGLSTVVLFGSSSAAIWGPWKTRSVVLQDPRGIASIPADAAIGAVERILPVNA